KRIENGAKTGIIRLNLVKFNYFSKPRQSREKSSSMPLERAWKNELNAAIRGPIKNDDYDSEGDIRFLEELLSNDFPPLPENESSNLDHFNDPSSSRPPPKLPDVKICFDFKPNAGIVTTKVVKGISEHYVLMPNILPTLPTFDPDLDFTPSHDSLGSGNTIFDPGIFIEVQSERLLSRDEFSISFIRDPLSPVNDTLLPFSSENEDKVFNPGILISPLLSHRGEIISNFSKSPMMISGGDIPHLDVPFLHFYPP
ncbi:hypothetical protein Tco_0553458, partial [Tanacetum coccineum]